ncbi:MAG: hypothetical protein ACE365_04390 [Gammaproteobacteria bacterium]
MLDRSNNNAHLFVSFNCSGETALNDMTLPGCFANGVDGLDIKESIIGFGSNNTHYKMAFDGNQIERPIIGAPFALGIRSQCAHVEKRVKQLLFIKNHVFVTAVGMSRGGVAALLLAKMLGQMANVTVNLVLFDPVPGNLVATQEMLPDDWTIAGEVKDLREARNLENVLAFYCAEPLEHPLKAFYAPIVPAYGSRTHVREDVVPREHLWAFIDSHDGSDFFWFELCKTYVSYFLKSLGVVFKTEFLSNLKTKDKIKSLGPYYLRADEVSIRVHSLEDSKVFIKSVPGEFIYSNKLIQWLRRSYQEHPSSDYNLRLVSSKTKKSYKPLWYFAEHLECDEDDSDVDSLDGVEDSKENEPRLSVDDRNEFTVVKLLIDYDNCADQMFTSHGGAKDEEDAWKLKEDAFLYRSINTFFQNYNTASQKLASFSMRQDPYLDKLRADQNKNGCSFESLQRLGETLSVEFDKATMTDVMSGEAFGSRMHESNVDEYMGNYILDEYFSDETKVTLLLMHAWKISIDYPEEQIFLKVLDSMDGVVNRLAKALENGLTNLIPSNVLISLSKYDSSIEIKGEFDDPYVFKGEFDDPYVFKGEAQFKFFDERSLRVLLIALNNSSSAAYKLCYSETFKHALSAIYCSSSLTSQEKDGLVAHVCANDVFSHYIAGLSQSNVSVESKHIAYYSQLVKPINRHLKYMPTRRCFQKVFEAIINSSDVNHVEIVLRTYIYIEQFKLHAKNLRARQARSFFRLFECTSAADSLEILHEQVNGALESYLSDRNKGEFLSKVETAISSQREQLVNHHSLWTRIIKGFWEPLRMLLNTFKKSDFFQPIRTTSRDLTLDFQKDIEVSMPVASQGA